MKSNESLADDAPEGWDKSVFIAGNLHFGSRLQEISNAVTECGFQPKEAREFGISAGTERRLPELREAIQQCKYAIFESSSPDIQYSMLDDAQRLSVISLCLWDDTYQNKCPEIRHPIFINYNKPYHDTRTLEKEVFKFLGYAPHGRQRAGAARIYVDDIDSFSKVKQVGSFSITDIVPIKLSESQIKKYFAEIIGEPFVQEDWGGESCDLFTNYIVYQGTRKSAGFVFKGPGLKRKSLNISGLGKNGDQIVRLTSTTQDLYAVQYINSIDQNVIEHLDAQVGREAHRRGKTLFYCVINGADTARLFRAYGKI